MINWRKLMQMMMRVPINDKLENADANADASAINNKLENADANADASAINNKLENADGEC
jgi:hypothetical protein